MDEQWLEPTFNSSVLIQDVALKTYRKRWTIEKGGRRGSGISMLMAWHDDEDNSPKEFLFYDIDIAISNHFMQGIMFPGIFDWLNPVAFASFFIFFHYYYYCCYFTPLRVFHASFSWCFSTGAWVTASFLKSPGLFSVLYFDLLTRPKMPFQGDLPEGGDTFQWQLWEEIAWAEIGWWNGTC